MVVVSEVHLPVGPKMLAVEDIHTNSPQDSPVDMEMEMVAVVTSYLHDILTIPTTGHMVAQIITESTDNN